MSNLLPILSNTDPLHLYNGRLYNDNIELLTSNGSIVDIIEMNEVPIHISSLYDMMVLMNISNLVNVYITHDQNVVGVSFESDVCGVYINNDYRPLLGMNCDLVDQSYWNSLLATLDSYELELDIMISKMPPTDIDPLYLVEEGDISDYVSFQNNEIQIGDLPVSFDTSNVEFNNITTYFKSGSLPKDPITFTESISIPVTDRLVKNGDIIDLVIGYRDLSNNLDPIESTKFDESNITFNGSDVTWGRIYDVTRRVLIQIDDDVEVVTVGSDQKSLYKSIYTDLEGKMHVDISSDRVVIYSISNEVNEYYIKSCRLLKILTNGN
jgi:hypothetical protein